MLITGIQRGGLLLCALASPFVAAQGDWQQLSKQLQQLHQESSDRLRWILPNEEEVLSADQAGVDASSCAPPIPAQVTAPIQLLVPCSSRQLVGFFPVKLDSLTAWTYDEGEWAVGQMVYLKVKDYSGESLARHRRQVQEATHWHSNAGQYAKLVAQLSNDESLKLSKFWRTLPDLLTHSHASLDEWAEVAWPKGLIGFRRGGGLLLQAGSLAGLSELQQQFAAQELPPAIQGVYRPAVPVYRYRQASQPDYAPMYLLHSFSHDREQYAIGLAALAEEDVDDEWQVLSREGDYVIVLTRLNRDF